MKCLVRIRLKNSDTKFSPLYGPGVLAVMEVVIEREPRSLDAMMHQIKIKILDRLFDIDYTVDGPVFEMISSPYVQ